MNQPPTIPPQNFPPDITPEQISAAIETQLSAYQEVSYSLKADIESVVNGCFDLLKKDLQEGQTCIISHLVAHLSSLKQDQMGIQSAISSAIQSLSGSLTEAGISLNPGPNGQSIFIQPMISGDFQSPFGTAASTETGATKEPYTPAPPPDSAQSGPIGRLPGNVLYDVYFNPVTCVCSQQATGLDPLPDPWILQATAIPIEQVQLICAQLEVDCNLARITPIAPVLPTLPGGNGSGKPVGGNGAGARKPIYGDPGWYLCCSYTGNPANLQETQILSIYTDSPGPFGGACYGPFATQAEADAARPGCECQVDATGGLLLRNCLPPGTVVPPAIPPAATPAVCCPCPPPDWITWIKNPCDPEGHKDYKKWGGAWLAEIMDSDNLDDLVSSNQKDFDQWLSTISASLGPGPLENWQNPTQYTISTPSGQA